MYINVKCRYSICIIQVIELYFYELSLVMTLFLRIPRISAFLPEIQIIDTRKKSLKLYKYFIIQKCAI